MNDSNYLDWIESQFSTDEIAEIEQANDDYWHYLNTADDDDLPF